MGKCMTNLAEQGSGLNLDFLLVNMCQLGYKQWGFGSGRFSNPHQLAFHTMPTDCCSHTPASNPVPYSLGYAIYLDSNHHEAFTCLNQSIANH